MANDVSATSASAPPPKGERHALSAESELRIEVPQNQTATLRLVSGSAEIFGAELATDKPYALSGTKVAVFTWHGCTVDVDDGGVPLDIVYVSDETNANVAFVNTHAQLEAMRDEALAAATSGAGADAEGGTSGSGSRSSSVGEGPRVLLAGPADCGKSSLARVLTAYAVKLGRSPLLIDLDVSLNMLSVPGTLSASPMTPESVAAAAHASAGSSIAGGTTPLVLWYGSNDISANPDLYKAQLDKLGSDVDERLGGDVDARADGFIVNTPGEIEDVGYKCLLHAADALRVNVILVLGHDRLYSMLTTHYKRRAAAASASASASAADDPAGEGPTLTAAAPQQPKVIKLPRSGGVVSRDAAFRRACRSMSVKRYFNGEAVKGADGTTTVNQYTPFLLELPFSDLKISKLSGLSLTASMLPVSAKQSTDPVQLTPVQIGPTMKHAILAVCHPNAVASYERSGEASDLYLSGVAGFVAVEKVDVDREIVSLLSPCAGSLPSFTLLLGDITWME